MASGNFKLKSEWIVRSEDKGTELTVDVLFICDPNLNTECTKKGCGECKYTSNLEFAKKFEIDE